MSDAGRGKFDLILAEVMDRLSRDQEDIAGLHKRMSYAGVQIVTLSEGEITHLHVGLKGTMNALFLKDLADKTRRGRVEAGKSGGGNAYGYDVVKKLDANGEPIRGDRSIKAVQAKIVERIFQEYAAGKSAIMIAVRLNPDMAAKYRDMCARGKLKKVALTAIIRKLLELANDLIRDRRKWSPKRS